MKRKEHLHYFRLALVLLAITLTFTACKKQSAEIGDDDNGKTADYVGLYVVNSSDPQTAYIELFADFSFKGKVRQCQGCTLIEGSYDVSQQEAGTIISLQTQKTIPTDLPKGDFSFYFRYGDDRLYLLGLNAKAFDCSGVTTLKKADAGFTGDDTECKREEDVIDYSNRGKCKLPDGEANTPEILDGKYLPVDSNSNKVMKEDAYLSFKSDGTYVQVFNMCEGYWKIKGTYTLKDNILTLTPNEEFEDHYIQATFIICGKELIAQRVECEGWASSIEEEDFWFDCTYAYIFRKS